ncbi:hypothetical protein LOC67_19740 [Stieleria sp. JC731]|uniref:hypothetical protein n=1 Tax=Pirellulaceae TaxID=2691357 RepID=UPI001E3DB683|nr:hypothetical protein [Stieleria sp. JC731]MCC9602789.1 hypothetical protein [Stieleria sp. JC731]
MPNRKQLRTQLLVTGCAAMVACSTGCRSAMPKWNMFGFRKAPSAEMLAGNGPSHTYPAPPSSSATPMAIASNAAGTSDMVADAGKTPGVGTAGFNPGVPTAGPTSPAANMAAAQANGFALASGPAASQSGPAHYSLSSNVSTDKNSSVPAIPAGYQFGTKATPPGATATAANTTGYQIPSSYPAPSAGGTGSSYSLPSSATSPISPSSIPPSTSYAMPGTGASVASEPSAGPTTSGFALPDDVMASVKQASATATNAAPFTPKTNTPSAGLEATPNTAVAAISMPAAGSSSSNSMTLPTGTPASTVGTGSTKPSFSTASASFPTGDKTLSLPSNGVMSNGSVGGSYAPGSTGTTSGYPATSGYPGTGTNGSFYR